MYENEFTGALQAIAESVTEQEFNAIVEGASILIEEDGDLAMDEAVQTSAAMLYNEDAIGDDAFAVTDAVIDEFANNRPLSWNEGLTFISETIGEDAFNDLMNETVGAMLDSLTEAYKRDGLQNAWEGAKAQGMTKKEFVSQMGLDQKGTSNKGAAPSADDKARKIQADKQAREQASAAARARLSKKLAEKKAADKDQAVTHAHASGYSAGKVVGNTEGHKRGAEQGLAEGLKQGRKEGFNTGFAQGAKAGGAAGERNGMKKGMSSGMKKGAALGVGGALVAAGATYGAKKLYDKVQANKAAKAAEEAKLSNRVKAKIKEGGEKAGELADKVKEKFSPKTESAYTLADLRALAEATSSDAVEAAIEE